MLTYGQLHSSSLFITWLQQLTCWSAFPFANLCKEHHFSKISRHFPTLSVFKYVLFSSLTYRQAITETGYSDHRQVQYTASHVCRDISFEPTVDFKHNFWTNLITPVQNHCKWRLPIPQLMQFTATWCFKRSNWAAKRNLRHKQSTVSHSPCIFCHCPQEFWKNPASALIFSILTTFCCFFQLQCCGWEDSKKSATRFCRFLWEELMLFQQFPTIIVWSFKVFNSQLVESDQLALKMSMK